VLYSVKEVEKLTGVTVKALHHYHKISLLLPCEISDAGYRFYGEHELEKLQQILFYRELDFSLKDIKKAMDNEPNRFECLTEQKKLLLAKKDRIASLLTTIENSINTTKKGEIMDKSTMFKGLN
jgi:DNA-binding transcriptional MerR regulator